MSATIGISCELDLTIHQEGIVELFDKWRDAHPQNCYRDNGNSVYRHNVECWRCRCYWLVGLTRGADTSFFPGGHNPADYLYIHIYPNIPMQEFYKEIWSFLEEIGVKDFELRLPYYVEHMRDAAIQLLDRSWKNVDDL